MKKKILQIEKILLNPFALYKENYPYAEHILSQIFLYVEKNKKDKKILAIHIYLGNHIR